MDYHLVFPRHGRISREWLALCSGEYHIVVEEEQLGVIWLVLYEWDAGWEWRGSFRMGMHDEFGDEVIPHMASIVDIGEGDEETGETILVVEENKAGFWLLFYEWMMFWEQWNLGFVYYVRGGRYASTFGEALEDDVAGDLDDGQVGDPVRDEGTPSLSDNDYQD
jgi:hypothetical protein